MWWVLVWDVPVCDVPVWGVPVCLLQCVTDSVTAFSLGCFEGYWTLVAHLRTLFEAINLALYPP